MATITKDIISGSLHADHTFCKENLKNKEHEKLFIEDDNYCHMHHVIATPPPPKKKGLLHLQITFKNDVKLDTANY